MADEIEKVSPPEKPKKQIRKKPVYVKHTLVQYAGKNCVVEAVRSGKLERKLIPQNVRINGKIELSEYEKAEHYGENWEAIFLNREDLIPLDYSNLDKLLKTRGIWTKKDFNDNPNQVVSTIANFFGMAISDLRKEFMKKQQE